MEYEFRRNTLTGTLLANFSMDHEVLGRWFAEELGDNDTFFQELIDAIAKISKGQMNQWRHIGSDLSIELDNEQVRVFANVLGMDEEHEFDEQMDYYDAESESFCGLEDFEQALMSWHEFVNESK
ncbi:YacL family protein [Shewanella marina]|uniref:YacL family protein n=1 Tax=Shewanella marina TaxID=487319 RepID=UPI00046EB4FB|nr:YacL family protein [Shewanella marina]